MHLAVDRLRIEIETEACEIPQDERARLQNAFAALADCVRDFPDSMLRLKVIHHMQSQLYHVEGKLRLPGRTILTGENDPYLDSALQRCISRLIRRTQAYQDHPDREALTVAAQREALDREVVAPESPDAGPLAQAAQAGDYRTFRTALAGYEDWLRKRIGRLVQRIPQAQARLGQDLLLGDLIEEVYLNAFEQFTQRPTTISLSEWLESLIEPSIRSLLRHPVQEAEAASLARTVRETPMP